MNPPKRVYVILDEDGTALAVENSPRQAFYWAGRDEVVFTYELVGKTRKPAKKKAAKR